MPTVGVLVLAAGGSSRLGTPKQLLDFEGRSLLRRAAETAVASTCRPIVVVLGAYSSQCLPELHDLPVSPVENTQWATGMGSSIRAGMETLLAQAPDALEAVIVMLCDQPLLTSDTLNALITEYRTTACLIVASRYGETSGVPALFHRSLFPELSGLDGAQGAKLLLERHADRVRTIAFNDGAIDIDTPADYDRFGRP